MTDSTPPGLSVTALTPEEFRALCEGDRSGKPHDPGPTRVLEFKAHVNRMQFDGLVSYLESHGIRVEYRPTGTERRNG